MNRNKEKRVLVNQRVGLRFQKAREMRSLSWIAALSERINIPVQLQLIILSSSSLRNRYHLRGRSTQFPRGGGPKYNASNGFPVSEHHLGTEETEI
ncbi:hypothetical protein V1478_004680 [Vespula squamosa]|uniref:Uncharacterized protein n=1 Tax=Vespula squamosa TaxID=30214 RepID=A0ABD2BGW5_VESSQ